MKVVQVVPYIGEESSGPSYSVPALCHGLQQAGCEVALHVLAPLPKRDFDFDVMTYRRHSFPHVRLGRSPEMLKGLSRACESADVIHNSSLWMFPNVYCDWARRRTKCKLVMQPRGAMSPWAMANSKMVKSVFGHLFQYEVLRHVDMWVATAESEYEDIRGLGYKQPICILPNGIDVPEVNEIEMREARFSNRRRRLFYLSRIHPKKNVELLLRVWARLEAKFSEWDLVLVGPDRDNPYADQMKKLVRDLGCSRVMFVGELNGVAKREFIMASECMVLPTHSENFGMVIAEALACEVPAICSYGAPWAGLNTEKCGWWVPTTLDAFELSMSDAMSRSRDELLAMGRRGREWMCRDFAWDSIGVKMRLAYEWLIGLRDRPDWVRI